MKVFIYLLILIASLIKMPVYASKLDVEKEELSIQSVYKLNSQEAIERSQLDAEDKELLFEAAKASQNAYSPFSKYYVGCALKTIKGNIFTGCNALTTGLAQEGSEMKLKKLAAIAIDTKGNLERMGSPCGACRQFMAQFGTQAEVIYFYENQFHKNKVEDLLLHPFLHPFVIQKN